MMRLLRYIIIIAFAGWGTACTTTESPVLDMNDIIPEAKGNYDDLDSNDVNTSQDSLAIFQARFAPLLIEFDTIRNVKTRLIVDRFGHTQSEKIELIGGGQILQCYKWIYSDSSRVINALYNWIDCFGDDCKSTQVGEEKNLQKQAFHIFANDTALIYFESNHAIKTRPFVDYLESIGYDNDWNYILEQTRNGRVRWYKVVDDRKTSIKNNES